MQKKLDLSLGPFPGPDSNTSTPKGKSLDVNLKSILKTPNTPRNSSGVHFEPPNNLEETLWAAVNNSLKKDELDGFITHMKNQKGQALVDWLQKVQDNLSLLKPSLETFVIAMLSIPWADQEQPVVTAYKNFLTNLVSAQGYYTKPVVKMLLSAMLGDKEQPSDAETSEAVFVNLHEALRSVIRVSPLAVTSAISTYGKSCMPFMMTPLTHCHTNYLRNILEISEYLPSEKIALYTLVIDRLVHLDANLPVGEDLYDEADEDDEGENDNAEDHKAKKKRIDTCRDNLDEGMKVVYEFIHRKVNGDESRMISLYDDFLQVFEANILPSYATGHVQFHLFYICSLAPKTLSIKFLDCMWKKFLSPNGASIIRQTAVAYIASFIARAKFVDVTILRCYLKRLSHWVTGYLAARVDVGSDCNYVDVRAHGPFYAACQALLYMLAFRYEELVQGPKSIEFLVNLRLGHIVLSSLNPLKVCLPPVVKNFAAIARHYQLAYCETVIQRNNRLNLPVVGAMSSNTSVIGDAKPALLDTFFPFDPYRLKGSLNFVADQYREYQGSLEDDSEEEEESDTDGSDHEDEELPTPKPKRRRLNSSGSLSGLLMDYDVSPGFMKADTVSS